MKHDERNKPMRGVGMRAAAVGLLALCLSAPATAHTGRLDLIFWGNFGAAAPCQQVLARAGRECVTRAWDARRRCLTAQVDGRPCDIAATDAAVAAARQRARDRVAEACTERDANLIQLGGVVDAQTHVATMCDEIVTATASAVFNAVTSTAPRAALAAPASVCVLATARLADKLLRFSMRARAREFDQIAATYLPPSQKRTLVDRATQRVAHARARVQEHLGSTCTAAEFEAVYGRPLNTFLDAIARRGDCFAAGTYLQSAIVCPQPLCGNGMQEPGEGCDDGNAIDNDGCRRDCRRSDCDVFPTTYELIQAAIFQGRGCSSDLCHGSATSGGLDLRPGAAYENLVGAVSTSSTFKRIEPGDANRSLLWLRLAKATLGRTDVLGAGMPLGLEPLSEDELEALRLWIHDGAPRTGVIRGTDKLLNGCLPPPQPVEIPLPAPPPPGEGVQVRMPPITAPAGQEREYCLAFYYDFTDQVPPQFRGADGTTFRFNRYLSTTQPLNHHLILHKYGGRYAPTDPIWGPYTCRGGALDNQACDPLIPGACGPGFQCTTTPVATVGCYGVGPPDLQGISTFGLAGSQQTPVHDELFAPGVYAELPLKGTMLWNTHYFNPFDTTGEVTAAVNLYFAPPLEQRYPVHEIFVDEALYKMNVPACSTQEVCHIWSVPDGAQLFVLSSHTHQRGKRFRIFRGSFRCSGGTLSGEPCSPLSPETCAGAACIEELGHNADSSLLYTSFAYNDPVFLRFNPPLPFSGSAAERALTFCALYDNGFTNPAEVKRQSTSPPAPLPFIPGGPCAVPTHCVNTAAACQPCSGSTPAERNASCDSSPGRGDGFCDACRLTGGQTTEDEMFGILGRYYLPQ